MAIDHRNIDPTAAMIEAELIDNQRVGASLRACKQPPVGGLPYVTVTKRFQSHVESLAPGMPSMQRPIVRYHLYSAPTTGLSGPMSLGNLATPTIKAVAPHPEGSSA